MRKGKRKLVPEIISIDGDTSASENVVVSLSACKRTGEQEAEDLRRSFALTRTLTPFFPRGQRSKRRANIKYAISKQKKLDSGAFGCHFEKLWGSFSEDKRTSFTYLDCLWFYLYRRQPYKAKVLTWIKKKHIFSKKYVLVPIICWHHWSLLIFCHFGESLQSKTRTPCMLLLDSLQMGNPRQVEPDIRKFVLDIYKAEGRPENEDFIHRIPLLVPKVPQQTNNEECGRFVLYFSKLFVEGAPEDFRVEDYPYFMNENWFTPKGLESFCEKLGTLNGLPLKAWRTSGRLGILKKKT
ncbi:probable ubiquitin-like-specific protease 2A [Corylus avellana]|uniref:probable ubiquitin-like-specific protease 2A n=1 Tax=Corylus avellana TaxID=13451 RepID=UPI00286B286E|nr:probable ubiquitin-like-specific protease 2A [Corylus avellana]